MSNAPRRPALLWVAGALFTGSGFSALALQTAFNKYFSFVFGVGAYATATVLATFMTGLAVGGWLLGRVASARMQRHLAWYGLLELAIGLYAWNFVSIAGAVESFYLPYAADLQLSLNALTALRFVSALLLVGVPSLLMGGTLPVLVEGLRRRGVGTAVNVLYALNIVGAAVGTLVSAYIVLPRGTLPELLHGVAYVNAAICLLAVVTGARARAVEGAQAGASPGQAARGEGLSPRVLAALAFLSGYVTFSNEVYWNHLLGLVVGTSVYAYAIMLFTTLLGMSVGGVWAERALAAGRSPAWLVRISQLGLAAALVLTLPLWDKVPGLFVKLDFLAGSFAGREVVRFVACALLVLPPAVMAGLTFPVVLAEVERGREAVGAAVGRLTAINTLGTVAGSLLAGFVLLDRLGGRGALLLSALVSVALTALLPGTARLGRWGSVGAAAGAWALGAWLVPAWDPSAMLSGSNIYFGKAHDAVDEVVWQREDFSGGVTSVIRTGKQLTLLTNGKFQGNNGSEVKDQRRFALIPNLFVERPERGLNIGLGTATTLGVMGRFPYKSLDAVELSPDIVEAARRFFADVNGGVLERPDVAVHLEDGRNFLALNRGRKKYDLISIELTSVWFAGAGNLYNDEFYRVAKENLSEGGVLQQWIQLHHVDPRDVAVIVGTLRKNFRHVQLWLPGHQGILVASDRPLRMVPERLAEAARLFPGEDFFARDARTLAGELLLSERQVDAWLAAAGKAGPLPLSTDLNLFLEFSTPRGNALGWNYDENLAALLPHSAEDWDFLGELPGKDPLLLPLARLGRARFHDTGTEAWHRAVEEALAAVPGAEQRLAVKRGLLSEFKPAPPRTAVDVP